MFNLGTFNSFPFNTIPKPVSTSVTREDIQIDNLGLQNPGILSLIDDDDLPNREIKTERNATLHGSHLLSARWTDKIITVSGICKKKSEDAMTDFINELKRTLRKESMNLYVRKKEGVVFVYDVILKKDSVTIDRSKHFQIEHCDFEFKFLCVSAFAKDEKYNSLDEFNITNLSHPTEVYISGTEETVPVFIITFNSAVDITKVTITNNTNNQFIEVSSSFSTNDVLVINGDAVSDIVQKNSITIESEGEIPDLNVGTNSITISITGTSVDYNLNTKFKNNYL